MFGHGPIAGDPLYIYMVTVLISTFNQIGGLTINSLRNSSTS